MSTDEYDVFVCYSDLDQEIVARLCDALAQRGVRPWVALSQIEPGAIWQPELERRLGEAPFVLICIGARGLVGWQAYEQRMAVDRAAAGLCAVIPVFLPGSEPPVSRFLEQFQHVDLRDVAEAWVPGLDRIARSILGPRWRAAQPEYGEALRPYRGLRPFEETDAQWFKGRDHEIETVLDAIRAEHRALLIVGASGCGKSSLLRAGVAPSVRTGGLKDERQWSVVVVQPWIDPCRQLAAGLVGLDLETSKMTWRLQHEEIEKTAHCIRLQPSTLSNMGRSLSRARGGRGRLLVIVDTAESLLVASTDPRIADRAAEGCKGFLHNLNRAASDPSGHVHVIMAARTDAEPRLRSMLRSIPGLADPHPHWETRVVPLIDEAGLSQAILLPAQRAGHRVDAELLETLLVEARHRPDAMPLVQDVLEQVWERRDREALLLTHEAYLAVGGLSGSIQRRAETKWHALMASGCSEDVVRRLFLALVSFDDHPSSSDASHGQAANRTAAHSTVSRPSRKRVHKRQLLADAMAEAAISAFTEVRLLTYGDVITEDGWEETIEITHEEIFVAWERLRVWLERDYEAMLLRQEIARATTRWLTSGRELALLWEARRATEVKAAADARQIAILPDQREFLEVSCRPRRPRKWWRLR